MGSKNTLGPIMQWAKEQDDLEVTSRFGLGSILGGLGGSSYASGVAGQERFAQRAHMQDAIILQQQAIQQQRRFIVDREREREMHKSNLKPRTLYGEPYSYIAYEQIYITASGKMFDRDLNFIGHKQDQDNEKPTENNIDNMPVLKWLQHKTDIWLKGVNI